LKGFVVEDDAKVSRLVILQNGKQQVQVPGHFADVVGVGLDQVFLQKVRNLKKENGNVSEY
jgi:hypothetical protein